MIGHLSILLSILAQKEKNNKLGYKDYGISAKNIQPFVIPYYI